MAKNIQVLLLEDISDLGRAGDIVSVSEGYARNFLFPGGKAAMASENVKHEHEVRAKKAEKEKNEQVKALQQKAEQLDGTELAIAARVKDESPNIFGRITASTLASELKEQAGIDCKAKSIKLKKPITEIGEYDIVVDLGSGVETTIHVRIIADGQSDKTKSKKK